MRPPPRAALQAAIVLGARSHCCRASPFTLLPWGPAASPHASQHSPRRPRPEVSLPSTRARCRRLQEAALRLLAGKRPADSHSFLPLMDFPTTLGPATWPGGAQRGGPGPQSRRSHQHLSPGAVPASPAEAWGGLCALRARCGPWAPADPGPPAAQGMRTKTSCSGTPASSRRERWRSSCTARSRGGGTRCPACSSQWGRR